MITTDIKGMLDLCALAKPYNRGTCAPIDCLPIGSVFLRACSLTPTLTHLMVSNGHIDKL